MLITMVWTFIWLPKFYCVSPVYNREKTRYFLLSKLQYSNTMLKQVSCLLPIISSNEYFSSHTFVQCNYNYTTGTCTNTQACPRQQKFSSSVITSCACCLHASSAEYTGPFQYEISLLKKINYFLVKICSCFSILKHLILKRYVFVEWWQGLTFSNNCLLHRHVVLNVISLAFFE